MKKIEIIEGSKRTTYVSLDSLMEFLSAECDACLSLLNQFEFDSPKYNRWLGHVNGLRDVMESL